MQKNKIHIGVTGTGSLVGQAIIKCIQKSSLHDRIQLSGFDYVPNTVGSYWCDKHYLLPDIFKKNEKEADWVEKVVEYIKQDELKLLFVGIDFELPLFARLKSELEERTGCIILVSSPEVIAIADDKFLTVQFLKENNLSFPLSFTRENYVPGALPFPLIVKPRIGARSVGFNLITTQAQFDAVIASIDNPIIQECVGSMHTEYTCGVIVLDNELRASIVLSRTLKEGNTHTADYRKDVPSEIYAYVENVAKQLKPFGVVNFQLRIDASGVPKIFEINARHSGTTYIRSLFGYNEVEYIICYLLHLPLPDMKNLKEGRALRFYEEFLVK